MSSKQETPVDRGAEDAARGYARVAWAEHERVAGGFRRPKILSEFEALCEGRLKLLQQRRMLSAHSARLEIDEWGLTVRLDYSAHHSEDCSMRIAVLPCGREDILGAPRLTWRGRAQFLIIKMAGKRRFMEWKWREVAAAVARGDALCAARRELPHPPAGLVSEMEREALGEAAFSASDGPSAMRL